MNKTEKNKSTVGEFLKRNNAIFSYLKDSNGNRVGMIIAVPSSDESRKEPMIGYAFFNETVCKEDRYRKHPGRDIYKYEDMLSTLADSPYIVEQLDRMFGGCKESLLRKIKLPYTSGEAWSGDDENLPCRISPRYIKKLATLQLARKRVNFFRSNFYEEGDELEVISRYSTIENIHAQVRKFEYRALRYYKYIPSLKNRDH